MIHYYKWEDGSISANYQSFTAFLSQKEPHFPLANESGKRIREEAVRFENESLILVSLESRYSHPEMKVTAANKRRHGRLIRTNWANSIAQTFYLPLDDYVQLNLNNQIVSTVYRIWAHH